MNEIRIFKRLVFVFKWWLIGKTHCDTNDATKRFYKVLHKIFGIYYSQCRFNPCHYFANHRGRGVELMTIFPNLKEYTQLLPVSNR